MWGEIKRLDRWCNKQEATKQSDSGPCWKIKVDYMDQQLLGPSETCSFLYTQELKVCFLLLICIDLLSVLKQTHGVIYKLEVTLLSRKLKAFVHNR